MSSTALGASPVAAKTAIVLTSDHGESLGEHDYYFDHGEDLFDPCLAIPLIVAMPGAGGGRRASEFAIYAGPRSDDPRRGQGLVSARSRRHEPAGRGDQAVRAPDASAYSRQNDRNLSATFDARYKLVDTPIDEGDTADRPVRPAADPGETRDASRAASRKPSRIARRELELFLDRAATRMGAHAPCSAGQAGRAAADVGDACESMRALGYVASCP